MKWFVPGPVPVNDAVLLGMQKPMISHRSQDFRAVFADCTRKLEQAFKAPDGAQVYSITGSGTMANEAAAANLIPDTNTLCLVNGEFGKRLYQACRIYNPDGTQALHVQDGKGINAKRAAAAIEETTPDWVCVVQNETATGVTNDVKGIAAVAKKNGARVLVDAVSSLGGMPLDCAEWGIDACTSASQKSLAAPPGLGFVMLTPNAMAEVEAKKRIPTYGLDLKRYKKFYERSETPYTPSLPTFYGLQHALQELFEEGLDARIQLHDDAARMARQAVADAGFHVFAEEGFQSSTITAFLTGQAKEIKSTLAKQGIEIAGGQGQWKGKMLRIASIGPQECRNMAHCTDALVRVMQAAPAHLVTAQ